MKISRVALSAAAGLVVAVGATGCNTHPGAAAVVGHDTISTQRLQAAVDRGLQDPAALQHVGGDRAVFVRQELSQLIYNKLVTRAAARAHVTANNTEIDAQYQQLVQQAGGEQQLIQAASSSGVPQGDIRGFLRYYVLQQKIATKLADAVQVSQQQLQAAYQQNIDQFDQVHSAHILVKTRAQAEQLLAQVRRTPSSFASLAARYSIDTGSKDSGGDLGFQGRGGLVKPFADAIFAAKPGTFLIVHSQYGWHVVHVIEHRTTTLAQATPQLKQQILAPQAQDLLSKEIAAVAAQVGVHVNPRYGVWNAAKAEVDPAPQSGQVSRPGPTPQT